jgi:hypothetical protein
MSVVTKGVIPSAHGIICWRIPNAEGEKPLAWEEEGNCQCVRSHVVTARHNFTRALVGGEKLEWSVRFPNCEGSGNEHFPIDLDAVSFKNPDTGVLWGDLCSFPKPSVRGLKSYSRVASSDYQGRGYVVSLWPEDNWSMKITHGDLFSSTKAHSCSTINGVSGAAVFDANNVMRGIHVTGMGLNSTYNGWVPFPADFLHFL